MTIPLLGCRLKQEAMHLIIVVAVVSGLTVYAACHVAFVPAELATVRLPPQVHDFGTLMPFSKSAFTFTGRNNLSSALSIDRVEKSCGCTSAECGPLLVLPGQTFAVNAVLSTHGDAFDVSSHITVLGHCGQQEVIGDYQLLGAVKNVIEFPDEGGGFLRLGSWELSQLPAQNAVAVKRGAYPLEFDELRVECNSSVLAADIAQATPDTWQVIFHLKANSLIGTFGYPVIFKFARRGKVLQQEVIQQAYMEMVGPFVASPPSLLLTASPGENIQKVIAISVRPAKTTVDPPEVVAVTSSFEDSRGTCAVNPDRRAVSLNYCAPAHSGTDRGEIIITLSDHGRLYKLRVGVLAITSQAE